MTVIAAVAHEGHVYMRGDTLTVDGARKYLDPSGKVWRRGEMVIGYAGARAVGQAIRYGFQWPAQGKESDDEFMRYFMPQELRTWCEREMLLQVPDKGHPQLPVDLLIGYRGRVWELDLDFCVTDCGEASAIGSGREFALGALYALPAPYVPHEVLSRACFIAASFVNDVGTGTTWVSTLDPKAE